MAGKELQTWRVCLAHLLVPVMESIETNTILNSFFYRYDTSKSLIYEEIWQSSDTPLCNTDSNTVIGQKMFDCPARQSNGPYSEKVRASKACDRRKCPRHGGHGDDHRLFSTELCARYRIVSQGHRHTDIHKHTDTRQSLSPLLQLAKYE